MCQKQLFYLHAIYVLYQWGMYVNTYATYELICSNYVTKTALHKQWHQNDHNTDNDDTTCTITIAALAIGQLSKTYILLPHAPNNCND